jgi:hypothetical protein
MQPVDYHAELGDFLMYAHVGRTHGCAVTAMFTIVGDENAPRCDLVGEAEESAVRARIGAKAFRAQHVHHRETADDDGDNRDGRSGKCFPELRGDQMVG